MGRKEEENGRTMLMEKGMSQSKGSGICYCWAWAGENLRAQASCIPEIAMRVIIAHVQQMFWIVFE